MVQYAVNGIGGLRHKPQASIAFQILDTKGLTMQYGASEVEGTGRMVSSGADLLSARCPSIVAAVGARCALLQEA